LALRAREIYYFVRVGNYASRPLRALQADFHKLGAAGDQAATRLERLQVQQRRLASQRVTQITRQARFLPGGRDFQSMQARQAQRLIRLQENQRRQLASIARAEERVTNLARARYDIETRITRITQAQNAIAGRLRARDTTPEAAARLRQMQGVNQRRLISSQMRMQENIGGVGAANAQIANQRRLFIETRASVAGLGSQVAREEAVMAEKAAVASRQIEYLNEQLRLNAAAQREVIAAQRQHRWDRIALGGRALSDLGRTAQYAGGLTILALGLMAREAAKFRTSIILAATQVGNNFRQVQASARQMGQGVLAQMRMFPASANDMAKASYDIYSSLTLQGNAQQQTAEGLKVLNIFNRAAVAGQTDLKDVTNAGITILNQFGRTARGSAVSINGLNKMMDQAFAAVRFGRETFQEFTTTLANAAPAAKAAHQSFANMAGTLAFLTRRLPVRQASVAYARLLEILQRSGQGLAQHGIQIRNQAGFMRPLDQIIGDIVKKFPKLAQGRQFAVNFFKEITKGSGTGTMGTIQARRALVFLVQQYTQYQHVLRQTTHDQGEFWKSFRALRASPEVKWRIFVNQLHALSIEIGQYAIPALMKLLAPVARVVKWFESLRAEQKRQIATFAVWTGGIALVAGTFAIILGTITRMITTFTTFGDKLGITTKGMETLAAEGGSISAVFARRLGIGIAILAMIQFHHQVGEIVRVMGGLHHVLGLISAILVGRMLANFIRVARVARTSAVSVVASEAAIGAEATVATGQVARLEAALLGLGNLEVVATVVIAYEVHRNAQKIRKNIETGGMSKLFDSIDKHIPILGKLDKITGFATKKTVQASNHYTKGYITIFDGRVYMWDGKRFVEIRPRDVKRGQQALGAAAGAAANTVRQKMRQQHHEQILHNRTVQQWIALAIKANKFAAAHPHNLAAQIRAARIMDQIQKRFTGAQLEGIQAVVGADTKATRKRISNAKQLSKEALDNMKTSL
jgi:TP901 family phage tail tape measure protein